MNKEKANHGTVTINGKEFKVRHTLRAMFIFEAITEKAFEIKTLLDNYAFFFSILLANNPDTPIDWNEFIDAMDADRELFSRMNDLVAESARLDRLVNGKVEEGEKDKKKE